MKYFQVVLPTGVLYYVQNKDGEFRDSSFIGSHFKTLHMVEGRDLEERDMGFFEDSFIDAIYLNENSQILEAYRQSLSHV